jgi:nicotinamide mononucleotide transporter
MNTWLTDNFIEIFGAVTGIIYVFLEIRQATWLWPLGIVTSAVYVWIFFTGKLYADMSLQAYYVGISVMGWYWWRRGARRREKGARHTAHDAGHDSPLEGPFSNDSPLEGGQGGVSSGKDESNSLVVTRLKLRIGTALSITFILLYFIMWLTLSKLTDSPVPEWDAFLTSLSIVATWMLARKIYEHWYLWIIVNTLSVILYFTRGLYPTVVLYLVYLGMSFVGLKAWKKTIVNNIN